MYRNIVKMLNAQGKGAEKGMPYIPMVKTRDFTALL
jgi:hypothetical protein